MKKIIHKTRTKIINGSRIKRRHKRPKVHYVGTIEFIMSASMSVETDQNVYDPAAHDRYNIYYTPDTATPDEGAQYIMMMVDYIVDYGSGGTLQLVCTGNANLWIAANHPNLLGIVDVPNVDVTRIVAIRSEVSSVLASCTAGTDTGVCSYSDATVTGHSISISGDPLTIFTYTGSWSVTTNLDITV